jgi:purine-nucleoside phosphorylase
VGTETTRTASGVPGHVTGVAVPSVAGARWKGRIVADRRHVAAMIRGWRPRPSNVPPMSDVPDAAARTARELARRTGVEHHDVLVILGTGLATAAEQLGATGPSIPLATLPFFPRYTAAGHHAQGWSVPLGDKMVLVFAGRCHAYEGIELHEVVHPLRTGIAAGCATVILTSAVGGIRPELAVGSVVAISDHLNLTGRSPLSGPEFVDMVGAYSPELRALARSTPGIATPTTGTYAHVPGPQFETPAEIRMLRTMGADVVGMSMAFETIAARHARAAVLGLAVVTNQAAGLVTETEHPDDASGLVDIAEIASIGARSAPTIAEIIRHVVVSLP